MAVNTTRWVKSLLGEHIVGPLIVPGKFQAGSTQAIKRGQLLKLAGGVWVPIVTDIAMAGIIAVAHCEIKAGDFAGYYPIEIPRLGDLWEFALDAAGAPEIGTAVYLATGATSPSETVTTTVGTNILGAVGGWPQHSNVFPQGHASDDASLDKTVTLRSVSKVHITIRQAASFLAALAP